MRRRRRKPNRRKPSMKRKPGMRVGVLLSLDKTEKIVELLGYGEYLGDEVPDEDAGGLAEQARFRKEPNPKFLLDNGDVVWGGECWWGPEQDFRRMIESYRKGGYAVRDVRIEEGRSRMHGNRIGLSPDTPQSPRPPPEPVKCPVCGWEGMSNEMLVNQRELEEALTAIQEGLPSVDIKIRCPECHEGSPRGALPKVEAEA